MAHNFGLRLATIRIFCTDLRATQEFYSDKLGMCLVKGSRSEEFLAYALGGTGILRIELPDPNDRTLSLVGRWTGISFEVDDVFAAYESLKSLGVRFIRAPEKQSWGGTITTMHDPDDNLLTLVQN